MSQPWFKFYPRDWRGDQALRAVSIGARGLWFECLCIMHEATPRGHLLLGKPIDNETLGKMAGVPAEEVAPLMAELEARGIFSRTRRKGVIYSRRMMRDDARSKKGAASVEKRWAQVAAERRQSGSSYGDSEVADKADKSGSPIT